MEKILVIALFFVGASSALTAGEANAALDLYKNPTVGGKGSYYGDNLDIHGTCRHIDPLPPYSKFKAIKMDVAMNVEQWFGSLACGMCLKVTHDVEGEFYAYVQDKCGGCGMGGLDLGVMGHGKPKQTIQAVQCPVENTFLQYKLEGDNFWLKVQIRNARVPIKELSLKQKDGSYKALKLEDYGAFTGSVSLLPSGNDLHIKMKSINGFEVNDVLKNLDFTDTKTHTGIAQVPLDSKLPKMDGDNAKGGKVSPGGKGGTGSGGKGGKGTKGGKGDKGAKDGKGTKGGKGGGGKKGGKGGTGGKGGKGGKGGGGKTGGRGEKTGGGEGETGKTGGGGKSKGPFSCKGRAAGTYGDPENCAKFIQCAGGRLHRFSCPDKLVFDTTMMNCNYPRNAKCA